MLNGVRKFLGWIGIRKEEIPQKKRTVDNFDDDDEVHSPLKRQRMNPEDQFRIIDAEDFINPLSKWKPSTELQPPNQQNMKKSSSMHSSGLSNNKENAMASSSSAQNINLVGCEEILVVDDDEEVFEVAQPRLNIRPALSESKWVGAVPKPSVASRVKTVHLDVNDDDEVQCLDSPSFNSRCGAGGTGGLFFSSDPHSMGSTSARRIDPIRFVRNVLVPNRVSSHPHLAVDKVARLNEKVQFQELISKQRIKEINGDRKLSRKNYEQVPIKMSSSGPPIITIDNDVPEHQVIALVQNLVTPTTLASKLADQGFKAEVPASTRKPHGLRVDRRTEEVFRSSSFYSRKSLVVDMRAKYDQKQKENEERLKDPLMRVASYARQSAKTVKDIEERMRRHLALTEVVLLDEVVEVIPQLPDLTPEIQLKITAALSCTQLSKRETLVELFSLKITRHDMSSLSGLNWLNDEVINFYMNLLIERSKQKEFPNVYAFNTFFYPKLLSSGHAGLKRWTRRIDIFAQDLIVVPVHLGIHWCLAIIDFRDKHVRYYDSMGSPNNNCLQHLLGYLRAESEDKRKCPYNTSDWTLVNMQDIPQQMNGSDCGMFACMFAEYVCRNVKLSFTQDNMPYFRRKMVYEILTGKLMEFH